MKRYLAVFFLVCFLAEFSSGQQDPMYTQYMFNPLAYNPAYAGSRNHMVISALYRTQWINLDGSPETQLFTIHSPMRNERIGLGLSVFRDKIGVDNQIGINATYAYRFPVGAGHLAIGLQAGVLNWRADLASLTQQQPNDPAFTGDDSPSLWLPNFGAGIYFSTDLFYFGVSVPHILDPDLRKEGLDPATQDLVARQYRHFFLMGGIAIKLNTGLVFKPSFLIKNVGLFQGSGGSNDQVSAPTEFDLSAMFLINEVLWLGGAYRGAFEGVKDGTSYDSVDFLLGVKFKNGLRIGGAYDHALSQLKKVSDGTFEVMLGYEFNFVKDKVVTPRYF